MRSLADCDATSEAAHHLTSRAASYGTRARGEGTRRAYRSAWRAYAAWCTRRGRDPLGADPDTVAMYAVRLADDGRSVATLRVHLVAIQAAHRVAGLALDLGNAGLRLVLEGIVRSTGIRPRRQAAAATPDLLRKMLATRPVADTPLGARDRALLLLGFGAALRLAELIVLMVGDVVALPGKGLQVTIRRSKIDPHGALVAIWPTRPSRPAVRWRRGRPGWASSGAPRMRRCRCSSG
jgi:site-specific recombinase XerD